MDQGLNLYHGDIDQLVKASKHLQNKMRQELSRQSMASTSPVCGEREVLPPIWDDFMLNPYVENVVSDYLVDNSNRTSKSIPLESQRHVKNPTKQNKPESNDAVQGIQAQATKPLNLQTRAAVISSATVGIQVGQNQLQHFPIKQVKSKTSVRSFSPNKTQRSALKTSRLETAKSSHREAYKRMIKPSASTQGLPFQRFVGTSKGNIDFSEEHPNLELDTSSHQTTLFPRRMEKGTKISHSPRVLPENNSINLAAATIKSQKDVIAMETWKEVLLKNRSKERHHKNSQLKKSMEVVHDRVDVTVPEIKEPKDIEIILKPPNGLFQLEKQTKRLSKQKKCNFQHFPVMYIRPDCQVQRVANISIRGDSEGNGILNAAENISANVKYVECTHEEEKPDAGSSSPRCETDVANDKPNQDVSKQGNKFFKALESTDFLKNSSVSRDSSSASKLSRRVRSRTSSIYSCSSAKVQQFTSPSTIETTDNDVHHIVDETLSSTDQSYSTSTQDVIKNPPTRREVYVQTDYKETPAESLPPLPILPPSSPPPPLLQPELTASITFSTHRHPIAGRRLTTKQENDNYIEDDFITKIFERIRNDVPSAVQAFKDRSTTAHEAVPPESTTTKQHQAQNRSHHHQTSAISNASNVDLLPNEIEPGLVHIQAKRPDASPTILQMPPPVDSPGSLHSIAAGGEDRNFLLLQQNPLFVQTINRIKSSAIAGDGRIKEDRHKYPTDAEIKRAVKIFLNSLTLDDDGDRCERRKSIIKGDGVRKKLRLPRSELISSKRVIQNTSSGTSNSSSKNGNINKTSNVLRSDVSSSLTSTTISSSDLEQGAVDPHSLHPTHTPGTSFSEGEVLSIGEI